MTSATKLSFDFLVNTFNSMQEAVVVADENRNIIAVNTWFSSIFEFEDYEVLGKKTTLLYASETEFEQAGKAAFHVGSEADSLQILAEFKRKSGVVFKGQLLASEVKNEAGITVGFLGVISDITAKEQRKYELSKLTKHINTLVEITTTVSNDFDEQLQRILKLSTRLLDLEVGIISQINKKVYTVKYFYPSDCGLYKEQVFELGNTYCDITYKANDVVAIHDMGHSRYNAHPCYGQFALETYIGAPLEVDGIRFGTVNFSSTKPRNKEFSKSDKDLVVLIGKWVGALLHRKQIKNELVNSKEMYRIISERASDIVGLHSPNGELEYVSPSIQTILGYKPEELEGTLPLGKVHPVDRQKMINILKHPPAPDESPKSVAVQLQKKNGEYIWLEITPEYLFDKDGTVIGIKSYSREITDLKRLDKVYSQVGAMAKIGGWEVDVATGDVFWTDEMAKIFECTKPVCLISEVGLDFFPGEVAKEKVRDAMRKARELGISSELDVPFLSKKGNHKFVHLRVSALMHNKKAEKIYGAIQDITRKKREEILFNETQEMAHVGGWEFEVQSKQLYWSEEVYRLHEVVPGFVPNVENGILFYDEVDGSRDIIRESVTKALDTGTSYDLILTINTHLGNRKTVRARGKTEIRNGMVVKLFGTILDVTEEKRKERELERTNTELVELNEMTQKMNSIIGHDLKTPLSSIIGLSDFTLMELEGVEKEKLDVEEIKSNLELIYVSARNMAELLDDVFKWSRLQLKGIELNLEAFDLNTIIESSFETLQLVASQKNIELVNTCKPQTMVVADRTLCPTIVRNFISNAIKFSHEWGKITITTNRDDEYWSVSVKDEGVGMTKEVKASLFDAHHHPSKRGTKNEKGTGVGLQLCKSLAELHNGSILVESELGKGSTFTFKVPVNIPV